MVSVYFLARFLLVILTFLLKLQITLCPKQIQLRELFAPLRVHLAVYSGRVRLTRPKEDDWRCAPAWRRRVLAGKCRCDATQNLLLTQGVLVSMSMLTLILIFYFS